MLEWIRVNLWCFPFLCMLCFVPFVIACMVDDKEICIHEWEKAEDKPHEDYWDYSGHHVGVFKCRCKKCGAEKNRKYY